MRILLYRSSCTREFHEDEELLKARGYEVLTSCETNEWATETCGNATNTRALLRAFAFHVVQNRTLVIHPNTDADSTTALIGFCRVMDVPIVKMDDLPAMAPENAWSVICDSDLRITKPKAVEPIEKKNIVAANKEARTLGDRLRAVYRALIQWESRANAYIGDGLKNPVTRELRQQPKRYRPNTTITTTG